MPWAMHEDGQDAAAELRDVSVARTRGGCLWTGCGRPNSKDPNPKGIQPKAKIQYWDYNLGSNLKPPSMSAIFLGYSIFKVHGVHFLHHHEMNFSIAKIFSKEFLRALDQWLHEFERSVIWTSRARISNFGARRSVQYSWSDGHRFPNF